MSAPDRAAEALGRASRRAAVATALGAALVLGAVAWSAMRLRDVEEQVAVRTREVAAMGQQVTRLEAEAQAATRRVEALRSTGSDLLDFLARVTAHGSVRLIDADVDWPRTSASLLELPPGRRKQAALGAVLLAWKDIPFKLGGKSPVSGFDSPRFVKYLLDHVGIPVAEKPSERLSVTLMRQFARTDAPEPGDLLFYKGNVGNFVMIYLGPGKGSGQGVCLGTFESGQPVQVMDSSHFNTAAYPFIGYFKVAY